MLRAEVAIGFHQLLTRAIIGACPRPPAANAGMTIAYARSCNGVPIRVVSDSLGHSRSSSTIDTYAIVLPSQEWSAADRMDAVFG